MKRFLREVICFLFNKIIDSSHTYMCKEILSIRSDNKYLLTRFFIFLLQIHVSGYNCIFIDFNIVNGINSHHAVIFNGLISFNIDEKHERKQEAKKHFFLNPISVTIPAEVSIANRVILWTNLFYFNS